MPGSRGKHYKQKKHHSDSESSSDSDSYHSDSVSVCERKDRKEKKHHKKEKCDSDSYHSDSVSVCEKKDHKEKKHHKKEKCESESTLECYSNEKEHKKCESSSSSSECEERYNICDIYTYFKNRLLEDKQMMVAGSNAYLNSVNEVNEIIPTNGTLTIENILINYNIDAVALNSPFFVREDGVYIVFVSTMVDTASQFTYFVNGEIVTLSCVGTDSGAGQVVSRQLLRLKKDDNVIIRSYISQGSSIQSSLYAGGTLPGVGATFLIVKITALDQPEYCHDEKLSKEKRKLFRCLTEKLVDDKELMVRGFNVCGTFSNNTTFNVPLETAVPFNTFTNVHHLKWNPTTTDPTQVQFLEDGVYKIFFVANTPTPAQLSFALDGMPIATTIQGTSKGAGQVSMRTLLEVKKNQIISVLNHTSANGTITINTNAGGQQASLSAFLSIFKIAPLCKPCIKPVDCKIVKKFECYYKRFRNYLLGRHCLQVAGAQSYTSLVCSSLQTVPVNSNFYFSTNFQLNEIKHKQGTDTIIIEKKGIYDIFVDVATNEPLQYALFVNNVLRPETIFGRDSGANRCLLRQFVKLDKGDVVQVRNYLSNAGNVTTLLNAGGSFIGNNCLLLAFILHPTCCEQDEKQCEVCCKNCKPKNK